MQQNQRVSRLLTLLTLSIGTQMANAQFKAGIVLSAHSPMRTTADNLPGVRTGFSVAVAPDYTMGRFTINSTIGYQTLNTGNGLKNLAQQYGYTSEKGFSTISKSAGMVNLALGAGFNLLPTGVTSCGSSKPSLIVGAQLGLLSATGNIDEQVKNKAGEPVYAIQQTGSTSTPYYKASVQMIFPVSRQIALTSGVAYNKAINDFSLQQRSNGNTNINTFTYTDVQFSMGIQVSFKGITEKGIKRTAAGKSINEKGVKRTAAQAKGTNPLYEDKGNAGTNPMHESAAIVNEQPGNSNNEHGAQQRAADSTAHNPLYEGDTGTMNNPLYGGANLAAGQPIGGIVVKGGRLNNIIYRELLTRGLIMPGTPLNNYQFTITIKTGIINRKHINLNRN